MTDEDKKREHIKATMKIADDTKRAIKRREKFCAICGVFGGEHSILCHMRVKHKKAKDDVCEICNARGGHSYACTRYIHENMITYKCKLCGGVGKHYSHCTNKGDIVSENPEWNTWTNRFGHMVCPLCEDFYGKFDTHQKGCSNYIGSSQNILRLTKKIEELTEKIDILIERKND